MLCFTPFGKQHPGALPHPLPSSHRCLHQMVARETGTRCLCPPGSLAFESKPPTHLKILKTISSKMAPTSSGLPSPLPYVVLQMVFVKHAAVLDQLCDHKQAISQWSTGTDAICCCQLWSKYKRAALNPSDPHWALAGSLLHDLLPADLAVVAEGSLLNKACPSKKDYQANLKLGLHQWTKRNGLPSIPSQDIVDLAQLLWQQHTQEVTCHITKSSITTFQHLLEGAIFHREDKEASSLRIYCPCLYYQAIENTFIDPSIFEPVNQQPSAIVDALVSQLTKQYGKSYPWATGKGRQLPAGYILAKKKKAFQSGRPIISFVDSPFRPMLNILARRSSNSSQWPAQTTLLREMYTPSCQS